MLKSHALASAVAGLMMLSLAFCCLPVPADKADKFETQSEITMSFGPGGGARVANISVPFFSASKDVTMNITGLPSAPGGTDYPANVRIDVGDDGTDDWRFDGVGYGPMGLQDRISNGSANATIALNDGASEKVDIRLPKGADVTSAFLTFNGAPSPAIRKNISKTYVQVNGTKEYTSEVPDLPTGNNIDTLNASVSLKNISGLKNTTDVVQDSMNGFSGNSVYGGIRTGQAFKIVNVNPISKKTILYQIDVYTTIFSTPADDLYLEIFNTTGPNSYPTGSNITYSKVLSSNVKFNAYTTFTMITPAILDLNQIYVFILKSPNSLTTGYYDIGNDNSGSTNPTSKYNCGGCWEIYTTNNGNTWSYIDKSDLKFKTYVKSPQPLVGNDFTNITVETKTYSSKTSTSIAYNFTSPAYTAGKWPFTIKNSNPFDIIFNLSAETFYEENPLGIQLDIGDDATVDWSYPNGVTTSILTTDLSAKFNDALASSSSAKDTYGNDIAVVPSRVMSNGNGTLRVALITIKYSYTAKATGFGAAIDDYVQANGASGTTVKVPIIVRSTTAGKVFLNGLNYTYDGPPVYTNLIPLDMKVPEHSKKVRLLDLDQYFKDDYDATLTYSIVGWSPKGDIVLSIEQGRWFTADVANATNQTHWFGTVNINGIKAADSNGFFVQTGSFILEVRPVNDIPYFTSGPVTQAKVGEGYFYDANASDIEGDELKYSLNEKPAGMTIDQDLGLITWTPRWDDLGSVNVTVNVSDGTDHITQRFSINVTTDDHAPVFTSIPPLAAYVNQEYKYEVKAYDEDVNDKLVYSLDATRPWGMMMADNIITWTPGQTQVGSNRVVIHVSDGLANITQQWDIVVGLNEPPVIMTDPVIKAKVGKTYHYNVTAKDQDSDHLTFSLREKPLNMTITPDGRITWLPGDRDKNFTWIVVVVVTDGKVNVTQRYCITVDPQDPVIHKPRPGGNDQWMWYLLALIVIIIVVAVVAYVAISQGKKGKGPKGKGKSRKDDEGDWPSMEEGETTKSKPKVIPVDEGGDKGAPVEGGTVIEDVFLIYNDGRLINHQARRLAPETDSDIMSGMLTAIQNFIKDSFSKGEDGKLRSFEYGEKKILLSHGDKVYLALVLAGKETPGIRKKMESALSEIDFRYGSKLTDWTGRIDDLKGVGKYLKPLVAMSRAEKERAIESELVNLLGNVEFFKGFVVVKVALMNGAATVVTDAEVKLVYNKDALRLDHVQPDMPLTGSEVRLGNLGPSERKTVAFYLDPLICVKSNIDATVSFKDSVGTLRTKGMEQLKAEVVCPILYTDEEVNIAMLKRLIGELQLHDSKIFPIPSMVRPKRAFEIGKEVLGAYKAKLIREFTQDKPLSLEGWYYGKTKVYAKPVVVRLSVREAQNTIEFFVATDEISALTGLLAELGHEYARSLRTESKTEPVAPITDHEKREKIIKDAKLLIHRFAGSDEDESEAAPDDEEK